MVTLSQLLWLTFMNGPAVLTSLAVFSLRIFLSFFFFFFFIHRETETEKDKINFLAICLEARRVVLVFWFQILFDLYWILILSVFLLLGDGVGWEVVMVFLIPYVDGWVGHAPPLLMLEASSPVSLISLLLSSVPMATPLPLVMSCSSPAARCPFQCAWICFWMCKSPCRIAGGVCKCVCLIAAHGRAVLSGHVDRGFCAIKLICLQLSPSTL